MATYKRQTKCRSTCLKNLQKNQKILNCTLCGTFHHFNCDNLNKNLNSQFYNWLFNLCADSTFPFQTVSDSELDKLFSFDLDFPNLNPTYLNDVFKNADDNDDELNINDTYIDTNEAKVILRQNRTKQFSSLCVNARLLVNPTNFAKFQCLVAPLNFEPDVIAVNETWEKPGSSGQYKSLQAEVGSTVVQKYRGTVTRYFFSTVIGNDDTFWKSTVFSTVDTVLTILHDISVTFFF